MDKLYIEKKIAVVNPQISADAGNIATEQLKKIPAGHLLPKFDSAIEKRSNRIIKRSIDVIISLFVITCILSWLIPLLAILIKLDSRGPVFFLQERNKNGGKRFTCIKLRSMIVNEQANQLAARENDERITRIGVFLRSHYLDELPQFFNVLFGDMSVIGPRPHMLSDNIKYEKQVNNYHLRHCIKPGITGLAQVLGYSGPVNNQQKIQARVKMDIYYIRYWSPKLERVIFYRSVCKILGI